MKRVYYLILAFLIGTATMYAEIPEGYVSIYSLKGEEEKAPIEVVAVSSYQVAGPANGWGDNQDWDFSNYENLRIDLTFDEADAGNQFVVRFNVNLSVIMHMFTLPTEGTTFSAVIELEQYADEDGTIGVGGIVFYNGATHHSFSYDGTPTTQPVTINYVAVGPEKDDVDIDEPVNVFPAGNFDGYEDLTALLEEWTLKNGPVAELELLESTNTVDPTSEKMLKLVAGTGTDAWSLQLASPFIPLVDGNQYMITFDIRSEGAGMLRISTSAANQLPGNQYLDNVHTDEEWFTARYIFPYGDPNRPILAGEAEQVELNFDMGTVPGMTYYLDNVKVIDITGLGYEPNGLNLLPGGTFDMYEDLAAVWEDFNLKNGDPALAELQVDEDDAENKILKIVAGTGTDAWSLQLATPLIPLVEGNQYMVSVDVRSEGVGRFRISTGAANQFTGNQYWPNIDTDEDWTTFSFTHLYNDATRALIAGEAGQVELNFDMGTIPGMTYYLDNIKVFDITGTALARFVEETGTSIQTPTLDEAITVYTTAGNVNIVDAAGKNIQIFSITGVRVYNATGTSDTVTVPLAGGIYVVAVNNVATKVLVK